MYIFNWKIEQSFAKINYIIQLLIFYIISNLLAFIYVPMVFLLEPLNDAYKKYSVQAPSKDPLLGLILAPLIETLVFQKFIFHLLNRIPFFQKHPGAIVLLSALIFALFHCYNILYIAFAFLLGCLLMYIYLFFLPQNTKAFFSVAIIHFMHNIGAFYLQSLLK